MNFRTEVELPEKVAEIRHSDQIILFGSCFAENIGGLLKENKFRCDMNPFGILYNPLSIVQALRELLEGKSYVESDLFFSKGRWNSWMHHSIYSAESSEEVLSRINNRLVDAKARLLTADWLIVTWGTAYVYFLEGEKVVANCHKQPERLFKRRKLSVDEIVGDWKNMIDDIRKVNSHLKVLFTVSPIRHAKDGMHGNQLSKATLLLAVHELCANCSDCYYFPSYEIVLDELRDYRFYDDDMVHPSRMAINYLWECFIRCYFCDETLDFMKAWAEVRKGLSHKPFNPESEAYRSFLSQIVLKIYGWKEKLPYIDVQNEIEICETRLKI